MIPDIDIWRCAALMITNYGDAADIEAATEVDAMLAEGDIDRQHVWLRIADAIDELGTVKAGEARN
jgi:hypothetical protein